MSAAHHLYAVQEAEQDPCGIPSPPVSPAGCGAACDTLLFGRSASATAGCGVWASEKIAAGPAATFPFIIRHKRRKMKSKSTTSCCYSDSVVLRAIFLAAHRLFWRLTSRSRAFMASGAACRCTGGIAPEWYHSWRSLLFCHDRCRYSAFLRLTVTFGDGA
jgi:hypothetical protein